MFSVKIWFVRIILLLMLGGEENVSCKKVRKVQCAVAAYERELGLLLQLNLNNIDQATVSVRSGIRVKKL
jgi:hypothetical protein